MRPDKIRLLETPDPVTLTRDRLVVLVVVPTLGIEAIEQAALYVVNLIL